MSRQQEITIMIVCSDDRAERLAEILIECGIVYKRQYSKDTREWEMTRYNNGTWSPVKVSALPEVMGLLFFHSGQGDPQGIPDCTFRKEFAFSSPGLPLGSTLSGRPSAIPIPRRFDENTCPVRNEHLAGLVHFLYGAERLPVFCSVEKVQAAIIALTILCDYYGAVTVSAGTPIEEEADELATVIGWDAIDRSVRSRFAERFAPLVTEVREPNWWWKQLALLDKTSTLMTEKVKKFINTFLIELSLEDKLQSIINEQAVGEPVVEQFRRLAALLTEHHKTKGLAQLFVAEKITPAVVKAAYNDLQMLCKQH